MHGFYNDSKFHMWRACIGTIWIDGKIDGKELVWIEEKIENLNFTKDQKKILKQDLKNNINFPEVLEKITDQRDRAFLAYQMRIIGHLDNQYTNAEKKLFKSWNELVLKGVDAKLLEGLVDKEANKIGGLDSKKSLFESLFKD